MLLVNHVSELTHRPANFAALGPVLGLFRYPRCIIRFEFFLEMRLCLEHVCREIFIHDDIAELIVADLAISTLVKMTENHCDLIVRQAEAILCYCCLELCMRENAVFIAVKATEDIANKRELLPHRFADLFPH